MTSRRAVLKAAWAILWQQPLWAIPFALFFGTIEGSSWRIYVLSFKVSLVFAYVIRCALVALELFVISRFHACPPEGRRLPVPTGIALFGGTSVAASYVAAGIIHFTLIPWFLGTPRNVVISGMFSLVFSVLIGGVIYAYHFYHDAVARARAVEAMRVELAQAELRALRAQVNPHFLFNTLNTIAALIPLDPPAAEDTTARLAEVFRYALRSSDRELAPFGDELAFLRSYLEIERTRFGARLRIEESIEPGLEAVLVPSLLLQPVVENAVRHGIAPRPEGGTVRLTARREGGNLVVEVADDGPGLDPDAEPAGTGFGLHSVRERMRAGGQADGLTIDTAPGRGTRVRVSMPLETHPAGSN